MTSPAAGDGSRIERRDHPGVRITLTLALLSMFGPFTTDTVFPAFAQMGQEFAVSPAAMQQVTSVYLLAFGVMNLFHGPISDAVGRRPVMIVSTLVYAAACVGAALAPNLTVLLVFRVLQGASAGGGTVIARAVIPDLLSGPAAQRLMSHVQMIFGLAPAVAPVLGGFLLQLATWPIIFWFLAVYGLISCGCAASLPETHPKQDRSPLRLGPLVGSMTSLLKEPHFVRLALATALGFGGTFFYIGSAPIFIVELLGKGEQDFWMLFVPLIVGMILGAWTSGFLAPRMSRPATVSLSFAIAIAGALLNIVLVLLAPGLPAAVIGPAVIAFGSQILLPATQLTMMDMFPRQRGAVSSVAACLQMLFMAALTGVIIPLVTGSLLQLALGAIGVVCLGTLLWVWERARMVA